MNPNNIGKIIKSKEKSIEKDSLIDEWIHKAISSVIPFLGRNFKDSVYKALGKFPTSYEKGINYMSKRPFLKFDKKMANEADNAFARLYPLLYHELKRIMTELPQRSAAFGEFEQYMRKKWKEQEVCNHEYGEPTYTLYGYGRQCRICYDIQILKAPATAVKKK
jgi:hypothetical protein